MTLLRYLIILPLHTLLQALCFLFFATSISVLGLLKFMLPVAPLRLGLTKVIDWLEVGFGRCSIAVAAWFNPLQIECSLDGEVRADGSYLMISNHISWLDIMALLWFSGDKIPAPKFFLKRELTFVPLIGLAAWAMDMPVMRRYSRAYVEKYPHKKGKDIETTKKSCAKYINKPTTVINFVEGTRITPAKLRLKNSPFRHLLPAKAGGIAFTMAAMGEQFTGIIDITLAFPGAGRHVMMDLLLGRLHRIVIHAEVVPVTPELIGDYDADPAFRLRFQDWLNQRWQQKDQRLGELME